MDTTNWIILDGSNDVSLLSYRDSIPLDRQQLGMIVYAEVATEATGADRYYKLISTSANNTTPLIEDDWADVLESDDINLSDTTNFTAGDTVQSALDNIIIQLNAVSPGGFQGSWDGTGIPQIPVIVPPDVYTQGDFWRITIPNDIDTVTVGGNLGHYHGRRLNIL